MKINCAYCNRKFETYPSRVKKGATYCSKECYYKGREYKRGNKNPQYKRESINCLYCNKSFMVYPSEFKRRKYCSFECSSKHHSGLNNPNYKKKTEKICIYCGKTFFVPPNLIDKAKYCSKECADNGRRGSEAWNKGKGRGKILICAICNNEYYASPARLKSNSKYCSWLCFIKAKRLVTGKNHPLYKRIEIKCDSCGKPTTIIQSKFEMYGLHFCSRRCVGIYTKANQLNPSSIEIEIEARLKMEGIKYQSQFKYEMGVADFFIPPNLIIECDGEYWHRLEKVEKRDKRQIAYLENNGFKVLRLWESEINKNPQACIERIKQMHIED